MPVVQLDAAHKLLFKKRKEKSKSEEYIKVYALLSVNDKVTDSVLCYEYYNNAETLSAYKQIYYIDTVQRRIWTVMLTYDEESAEADAAKKIHNRFGQELLCPRSRYKEYSSRYVK